MDYIDMTPDQLEELARSRFSSNKPLNFGPFIIGNSVDAMLCGVLLMQCGSYACSSSRDRWWLKAIVVYVAAMNLWATGFAWAWVWDLFVQHFGTYRTFFSVKYLAWDGVINTGTVFAVQAFFALRAWKQSLRPVSAPDILRATPSELPLKFFAMCYAGESPPTMGAIALLVVYSIKLLYAASHLDPTEAIRSDGALFDFRRASLTPPSVVFGTTYTASGDIRSSEGLSMDRWTQPPQPAITSRGTVIRLQQPRTTPSQNEHPKYKPATPDNRYINSTSEVVEISVLSSPTFSSDMDDETMESHSKSDDIEANY
ncbi:hypothetical protein RhiJN_21422 [Ceratobasidium sp. AG-Ba]|nr:hypothetical protein RhiJN_21422 [Ceratobasidium sp. AG-Ba]